MLRCCCYRPSKWPVGARARPECCSANCLGRPTEAPRRAWQVNFEGEDVGEDYFCPLSLTVRRAGEERDILHPLPSTGSWGARDAGWTSWADPHPPSHGHPPSNGHPPSHGH